ncbi:4Fe-4S binding protein [Desulfovibrio aminophilus]|nr:4Fe-4S binding protein [Desulfovibrio aminophilus]MCM0754606.1 4Fe-4S binding protein [Desulfovibrio aminophilus]
MKVKRKLISIDEDLCDGCGQCVPSCAEGALRIIDGKARLVAERYCDGLGACLGECPTGALRVVEVETEDFDPEAVTAHLKEQGRPVPGHMPRPEELRLERSAPRPAGGCPGSRLVAVTPCQAANQPRTMAAAPAAPTGAQGSALSHWPVQIRLVPPHAPFLKDADLLVTADCAAAAHPALHADLLPGRVLLLGCPKFDDAAAYEDKFTAIFQANAPRSVTVLEMEVPCCSGLSRIVLAAMRRAGIAAPLEKIVLGLDGRVLGRRPLAA